MKTLRIFSLLLFLSTASSMAQDFEGCLSRTGNEQEEDIMPAIAIEKEGNILTVQLLNYYSNCGTNDFLVDNKVSMNNDDDGCTVAVNVTPVVPRKMDCTCPFNVTLTVRDVEANSFYLDCWWYEGRVSLTEGEPLLLRYAYEDVTINGLKYRLNKTSLAAMLFYGNTWEGELCIPSELTHEGQTYIVNGIRESPLLQNTTVTKVFVPKTIKKLFSASNSLEGFNSIEENLFANCKALETVEVDDENPIMCSSEGVLFNKDRTRILCYPAGSQQTVYTIPAGVTTVSANAFAFCKNFQSIVIPNGVTTIDYYAFRDCKGLKQLVIPESVVNISWGAFANCQMEALYILGILNPESFNSNPFADMSRQTHLYVQPSEVEKYRAIYSGPVSPLPSDESLGICDTSCGASTSVNLHDLQGRRVGYNNRETITNNREPLKPGVYIQNGKKIVKE